MKALPINDIKDSKVRNAVIIAQDGHKKGVQFSKAIIDAATFCKADIDKVTDYMIAYAENKMKE